jgi:hypothetical protein
MFQAKSSVHQDSAASTAARLSSSAGAMRLILPSAPTSPPSFTSEANAADTFAADISCSIISIKVAAVRSRKPDF